MDAPNSAVAQLLAAAESPVVLTPAASPAVGCASSPLPDPVVQVAEVAEVAEVAASSAAAE